MPSMQWWSLALVFALAACGGTAVIDPGSEPGAGGAGEGGNASGESCGDVVCAVDQVCCNASCGICTAPNEGCPAIACD